VLVNRFTDAVRAQWGGAAPAKGAAQKAPAKKEDKPAETKKAEEDDMDLFGDDEPSAVSFY